jgi:hypothetical protein
MRAAEKQAAALIATVWCIAADIAKAAINPFCASWVVADGRHPVPYIAPVVFAYGPAHGVLVSLKYPEAWRYAVSPDFPPSLAYAAHKSSAPADHAQNPVMGAVELIPQPALVDVRP